MRENIMNYNNEEAYQIYSSREIADFVHMRQSNPIT